MKRSEVAEIVNAALAEIEDERIRDLVRCKLIDPKLQQRQFEWASRTSEKGPRMRRGSSRLLVLGT